MTDKEYLNFLKLFSCKKGVSREKMEKYLKKNNIIINDLRSFPIIISIIGGDQNDPANYLTAHPNDIFVLTDEGINFLDEHRKQNNKFWIPIIISNFIALLAIIISLIALFK